MQRRTAHQIHASMEALALITPLARRLLIIACVHHNSLTLQAVSRAVRFYFSRLL
jgi:hypothetical protein